MKKERKENRSILQDAFDTVCGIRQQQYGSPVHSFKQVAQIATVLCHKTITAKDAVKVFLALKLVREAYAHKRDNIVDAAGYLHILNDVAEWEACAEDDHLANATNFVK